MIGDNESGSLNLNPPTSVSFEARLRLGVPRDAVEWPAHDDHDGWLELIRDGNAAADRDLAEIFGHLPVDLMQVGGVDVYVSPQGPAVPPSNKVNLNFHGGGLYALGGKVVRHFAAMDAERFGITTWSVDYRMPPEYPYPVGVEDALRAYRHLLLSVAPEDIVITASSAGGNIATAMLLRARDLGVPFPSGLVLFSPEVDLTESGDSFAVLAAADNTLAAQTAPIALYAQGHDLEDPYISPLFADLTGFPRTFVQAGTRDLFLSNAVRFHRQLREFGVEAQLHVFEAMPHSGFGGAPEDVALLREVRRFLDHLDGEDSGRI